MSNSDKFASKQQVEDFYNTYKDKQKKIGVNIRHRTILKNLKSVGLKANSKVIEIGCGIGTVSGLIIKSIPSGSFTGVDISSESVEMARKLNPAKHAEFLVSDMSKFIHKTKFDFVVLPDVLEHIPVEQHDNLFKVLNEITTKEATVLINIPEPNCLNWIRKHHPDKLQIIDQSLSMQDLLNNSYPHGFKLFSMNSYSLQYVQPDYTCIVLKKNMVIDHYVRKSKVKLGVENIKSKI
ncbi:MAG: methyltransferase domain-containing protein [Bacteroidetes bacterium]|nr:methyltransferase domain-containing protein [Bacteroidota bacterium]